MRVTAQAERDMDQEARGAVVVASMGHAGRLPWLLPEEGGPAGQDTGRWPPCLPQHGGRILCPKLMLKKLTLNGALI